MRMFLKLEKAITLKEFSSFVELLRNYLTSIWGVTENVQICTNNIDFFSSKLNI